MKHLIYTLTACLLTAACVLLIGRNSNKKIAVADAVQLFNNYKMKQELEQKEGQKLEVLNRHVDSLRQDFEMQGRQADINQGALQQLYRNIREAEMRFEEEFQRSNQRINEQVWKRLNPLIDAYGKERKLRLIVGANGMGSVLYYDGYYDITKELTDFINKKYEEGN